ncbi:MAG TPA: alcohol dehydrogenase catalytic domain-containing protein [Polyangia bacterium]|jgi:L-iditol 2-dehydrogenase|nr:alcohol dehydrogenase catalytic domain-containing protein [Polyangia bacterium]
MAMRVAELTGVRQFRLVEGQPVEPGPGQVQVQVQAVGVCGSDMHSYAEGGVGDQPVIFPMVLGHEPSGVVAKIGPGVTGIAVGDRAAFEPSICCYHCVYCLRGRHNLCTRMRFLSSPGGEAGFFRDRVNLPAENLLPLPSSLSIGEGALVEPLAIALHSMKLAAPVLGETAAVFGAGPIGLLTIAALKLAGLRRVWAVEPLPHRRALALVMGADAVLDPGAVDAGATIVREAGGLGVDMVFDCATKGDTTDHSLRAAAPGARVVLTGIHSELRISVDIHQWRRKELAVLQVRRSNDELPAARDLLAQNTRLFAPLITHNRPVEKIAESFALVDRYDDGVGKLLVRFD